jgi:hypothetical protein
MKKSDSSVIFKRRASTGAEIEDSITSLRLLYAKLGRTPKASDKRIATSRIFQDREVMERNLFLENPTAPREVIDLAASLAVRSARNKRKLDGKEAIAQAKNVISGMITLGEVSANVIFDTEHGNKNFLNSKEVRKVNDISDWFLIGRFPSKKVALKYGELRKPFTKVNLKLLRGS